MLTTSPHVKQDKPYQQSPQYKKPHPYNPEASISLKNSINLKDFQFNEELEYYKNRSADLEQYVRQLKNELDTTIIRLSKQGALDEKVELVLHQNQLLSSDLDKLQKSFAQKKTECELWKSKYEQQLNSSVQLKAQYELDLRKLSNELKLLEERNTVLEKERNHDVEATKTNFSIQNEQQRHSYLTQLDQLENQLRKTREYADIRDKEVYELENKLTKVLQEREFVETKLLNENDHFRIKIQEQERDNQIEMNNLRQKLDILNQGQLDNIKNQFLTQVEIMDNEIEKLKGLLDIKNTEIETLIIQNQRLRANYDEEIQTIRLQFDVLKEKMLENEQQYQEESQQMETNLKSQHDIGVDTLKKHHDNQKDLLQAQVEHLNGQVSQQNLQLNELQKIRQQLLETISQDQDNAQNIINQLKIEIQTQSERYQHQIKSNFDDYQLQKSELSNFNHHQQQQIEQLQQQIQNLNRIIALKDQQFDATLQQYREMNNQLNNRLNELHKDNESIKVKFNSTVSEQEQQLNKQLITIKQLEQQIKNDGQAAANEKQHLNKLVENLKTQLRQKEQLIVQLRAQIQAAEQNLSTLEEELQEIKNSNESQLNDVNYDHEQLVQTVQAKQNEEMQQLTNEWILKEKQFNTDIAQLKGDLRTQQTLNSELNSKLNDLESQVQEAVNDQDIIKQYEVLSQVILTNRLQG